MRCQGGRAECSTLKPGSLVLVKACQGFFFAVCQGVKVVSSDIFGYHVYYKDHRNKQGTSKKKIDRSGRPEKKHTHNCFQIRLLGGGGYSFVACLSHSLYCPSHSIYCLMNSHSNIEPASISRRSTVPTPNGGGGRGDSHTNIKIYVHQNNSPPPPRIDNNKKH